MRKPAIIKFTKEELDSFIEDENSCVTINNSTYSIPLYPYHLSNVSESIKRLLNEKVAKYDQRLDGILLGYKNLKLITPYAALRADSCYIHVDIQGEFYIFKPTIGAKLTAVVNKTSSNHIGCLVHRVFNVSVPNKNENENENWPGFGVKVGNTLELSVTETRLDARLPYIRASIISNKTKQNISTIIEDENEETTETPKKQKNKKLDLIEPSDIVDNGIELSLESAKKQKKKRQSKSTENNNETNDEIPNVESPKKQKKKRNSEQTEINKTYEETLNNETPQRKKRHSEQTENNVEASSEDSSKKKKNKRQSNQIDNSENTIKFEELTQNTLILNDSQIKQKNKHQTQDESNMETNKITPKKHTNKILNDSQRTNESDYFATPKIKKKQKQLAETNKKEIIEENLEKGSLEDFVPKEKKNKTDSAKKKKNKQNDETEANSEVKKSNSAKKKKNKQNDTTETNLEALQSPLLAEQFKSLNESKKEKKRKSKELKSEQKPLTVSPVKPMADLEDRKNKKRRQSLSQNVDWENKELNLYDSDLEKTLNTPSDSNKLLEKSLEFNLAKIQALNANTPRKRKHKHNDEDDFITSVKKKSKIMED